MRTMFPPKPFQRWLLCCLSGTALVATAADDTNAPVSTLEKYFGLHKVSPEDDDWTRHFRLGAVVGLNINASFKEHGNFNVSGNNPAAGIYDNGYVRTDATGNAGGGTSYWGYNDSKQYDEANHQLTMLGSSSFNANSDAKVEDAGSVGFDMAYGANLWYWRHVRIGWEAGFGLLPLHIVDNHSMSASINQSSYTFSTLDPNGNDVVIPTAPYQGGASGQGPLIQYPSSFPNGVPLTPANGSVTGKRELDVMLYTLRLGATFYGDVAENIAVSVGVGPAIGLVSGNYHYDETIATASGTSVRNQGGFGSTEVVFGGYVNATVMYHFKDAGRDADVYLSAEYMPLSDATMSRQGREASLNMSGQLRLSIGLNWPF